MLPSKGYFNDIECPYLESNCGRPYCHFNHRKKQETSNDNLSEEYSPKEVPTYKPTPKSELAVRKSHIPISYVPDIYNIEKSTTRSFRNHVISDIIYKPTPISLLNSSVESSAIGGNCNLNVEQSLELTYSPKTRISQIVENEKLIDENKEKYEYKPEEQEVKYNYNPTPDKDVNEDSLLDIVYKPDSYGLQNSVMEYTPSSKQNSNIDFENLDTEFNMIDEIINMSDTKKKSNFSKINKNDNSLESEITLKVNDEIQKKNIDLDKHKNTVPSSKEIIKQNKKHLKTVDKDIQKESEKISKVKRDDKREKKDDRKEKKERSEKKSKDSKKHDKRKNESSRSGDRNRKLDNENTKVKVKDEGSNGEKETENSGHKNKYRSKEDKKESKGKDKDRHSKSGKNEKKHDKHHSRHNDSKKKDLLKSTTEQTKKRESSPINIDLDIDIDEQQTMEECFKIFNEYKPSVKQNVQEEILTIEKESDLTDEINSSKKRIAHCNASNSLPKIQPPKPIVKPTPGQVMNNRLKIVKMAQADNEEKLITRELNNFVKRPQPSQLFKPAKKIKLNESKTPSPFSSSSLIDEIINRTNKPTIKKIAPVSNVMNIQKAKESLKLMGNKQDPEQSLKTIAQTNKTGKRQAHIPDYSLSDIPDVLDADKSKLPVNVRSRFLTLLADECCKLYLVPKDAYKRALDEEYSCYQKCKVLVTYRNSAMLAVNRLRKELKEREEKNLGPIGCDEVSQGKQEDSEKKLLYKKIGNYVLTNEELDIHGYPRESKIPGKAIIKNCKSLNVITLPKNQKKCCRCSKIYLIDDDGRAIYEEECLYHPLKKRTIKGQQIYLCCKSTDDSGCVTCHCHVSETPEGAELEGFQTTLPPNNDKDPRSYEVYALDCEMCYTTKGLELTRVTVIDTNCKTVYESLVKPMNEIIDYNTRFSGITKQQMDRTSTGILQVQANILHLCNSKTILIGHSLESDMKALKIIHSTIVDTAVLFPHKMGLPHKRALRTLACDYLKKIIQNDINGHDSAEDAITCMELIKWKVKEDSKLRV